MLTTRLHESGLLLAEEAMDEKALTRALQREVRPDVELRRYRAPGAAGGLVYKIVHTRSGRVVATWADDHGRPLPLSSGIVEWFKRMQTGARNPGIDADEWNRRHRAEIEREERAGTEAIRDEHAGRLADRLTVSMSGRRHRRKTDRGPDGPRATPWRRKP